MIEEMQKGQEVYVVHNAASLGVEYATIQKIRFCRTASAYRGERAYIGAVLGTAWNGAKFTPRTSKTSVTTPFFVNLYSNTFETFAQAVEYLQSPESISRFLSHIQTSQIMCAQGIKESEERIARLRAEIEILKQYEALTEEFSKSTLCENP